jgi:hypothetical protein
LQRPKIRLISLVALLQHRIRSPDSKARHSSALREPRLPDRVGFRQDARRGVASAARHAHAGPGSFVRNAADVDDASARALVSGMTPHVAGDGRPVVSPELCKRVEAAIDADGHRVVLNRDCRDLMRRTQPDGRRSENGSRSGAAQGSVEQADFLREGVVCWLRN